jgi:hypothetical protein
LIASTAAAVDPASPCEAACRRRLDRISATVDAVGDVTFGNLANVDAALRGGLLSLIEARLICVGAGPTLDFVDANAFLAELSQVIDLARRKRLH